MTHRWSALAKARANIALAKYWGKSDEALNLPAVPSVSVTLDPLVTTTRVSFDSNQSDDVITLNGSCPSEGIQRRAFALIDRVRAIAGTRVRARIQSDNSFPTASGLASSASGFAALAAAATAALDLPIDLAMLSALARRSSASAARSIYGGFVELPAGAPGDDDLCARPLAATSHWDLAVVIAVMTERPKAIGSTEAMALTKQTSPYYRAWVDAAPRFATRVREGVLRRDLEMLGAAMEESTACMHACALAASPAVLYWEPATIAVLRRIIELRGRGLGVWATMDAGPHVKAVCLEREVTTVEAQLGSVPGVLRTVTARLGLGVEIAP